jgi:deoxyribodipyrimidine photolyase-like uncharacterized protein
MQHNPRLGVVYHQLKNMQPDDLAQLQAQAQRHLNQLNTL